MPLYPEDRQSGAPERALRIAAQTGHYDEEGWRARPDGSRFWCHVVIEPIQAPDLTLEGFVVISRDAGERRERELDAERRHAAEKAEIIGRLTAGFAHEFNNTLTAVAGSLDLIASYTSDERVRRINEIAQVSVDRARKLISQLLSFAGTQTLRSEVADLNQLIAVFEDLLLRAGGSTIAVMVETEPDLDAVLVDPAQLQSALISLVQNAREAMPDGGKLTIRTANVVIDAARAARLTDVAPGAYAMLEVGDTGAGMAPAVADRAADPFFTTKDAGRGSGLGLSQVVGFVRQSGGQVEIESLPGQGTKVRLFLPEHRPAAAAAAADATPPTAAGHGSVLVVEDNEDVLSISREILTSFGYTVYCAEDAVQALKILQNEVPIDVLFTDVVMPNGINGVELARRARVLRPDIRVLMASGYIAESLRQSHGFDDPAAFLHKPYRMTDLIKAITKLG